MSFSHPSSKQIHINCAQINVNQRSLFQTISEEEQSNVQGGMLSATDSSSMYGAVRATFRF